jgi:uncharacterized protein
MDMASITALNIYPIKSCRGIALDEARVTERGFAHDREWLIVRPDGRFVTQRECARLALIVPSLTGDTLQISAPGLALSLPLSSRGRSVEVVCWKDRCAALDEGDEVARWLSDFLGDAYRLVRFDPAHGACAIRPGHRRCRPSRASLMRSHGC